jgi:hypothetical protein
VTFLALFLLFFLFLFYMLGVICCEVSLAPFFSLG